MWLELGVVWSGVKMCGLQDMVKENGFKFISPCATTFWGRILRKEKSKFELSLQGNYQGCICQSRQIGPT